MAKRINERPLLSSRPKAEGSRDVTLKIASGSLDFARDDGRLAPAAMIEKHHAIAYWLLPDPVAREMFAKRIHELAARFGAPEFEPHVTVFIGPEDSRNPAEVLDEVRGDTIELTIRDVRIGDKFTKTLFVQFAKSNALQDLGDRIWRASGAPDRHMIDPHLSLLYANLGVETKKALADEMKFAFPKVVFSSACAMRCAWPTTTAAEVENWKLLSSSRCL